MTDTPRVFIDTCLLVNLAVAETTSDEQNKFPGSRGVISAILDDKMRGYISVITIAELLGNGEVRGNHIPKKERHRRITEAQAWLHLSSPSRPTLRSLSKQGNLPNGTS